MHVVEIKHIIQIGIYVVVQLYGQRPQDVDKLHRFIEPFAKN
jgi:hypothetical protein